METQPLAWYSVNRPEATKCAASLSEKVINNDQIILVEAEVKSGKRIVKIITRLFLSDGPENKYSFLFITALNRKDTKEQQLELEQYGIQKSVKQD